MQREGETLRGRRLSAIAHHVCNADNRERDSTATVDRDDAHSSRVDVAQVYTHSGSKGSAVRELSSMQR